MQNREFSEYDMITNVRLIEKVLIEKFGSISEAARKTGFKQSDLQKFLNGKKDFRFRKVAELLHKANLSLSLDLIENGFVKDRFKINSKKG
jgi:DNA-binding phage protein